MAPLTSSRVRVQSKVWERRAAVANMLKNLCIYHTSNGTTGSCVPVLLQVSLTHPALPLGSGVVLHGAASCALAHLAHPCCGLWAIAL
jgi:hypothetical protein